MSMIGEYARLTPAELDRATADPEWAEELVQGMVDAEEEAGPGGAADPRCHSTYKTWHALEFLLKRAGFPVDVVFGEEAVPGAEDWGYGPPRFLGPERVRVAAEALAATPPAALVEGVGPKDLAAAEVYPAGVWERGESLDWVTSHYEVLVAYFQSAAKAGDAVVMWLD
ncbi:YfbM family protein [Streptomyces sp. NPDC060194]|uniref:YfbM family protein n=1 Tax=Streptomyces sp. NPDC060194 TaxID=3347069 RepID=UPI003655D114